MEGNTLIFNGNAELHIILEKFWVEITSVGLWGNLGTILIFKTSFTTVVITSFFLGWYVNLFYLFLHFLIEAMYTDLNILIICLIIL